VSRILNLEVLTCKLKTAIRSFIERTLRRKGKTSDITRTRQHEKAVITLIVRFDTSQHITIFPSLLSHRQKNILNNPFKFLNFIMKKIVNGLFALLLLSCEKSISLNSDSTEPQDLQATSLNKPRSVTTGVITYDSWVVNLCHPEKVHLIGNAPYSIKTFDEPDTRYYIDYRISLNDVYGVGQTSGLLYKGNGLIDGRVQLSRNPSSARVEGKDTYKLRLITGSNQMLIKEDAHFIQNSNGSIKVEVASSVYDCLGF
jgi:hypothetical protein